MTSVLGKMGASLLGFFVGAFCGGMVAQVLAVSTDATEEFILVFVASAFVAIAITVPFFVAQFFDRPRHAIDRVAVALVLALLVLIVAVVAWTLTLPAGEQGAGSELGIYAGLILPNLTAIGAHWLVVRAMQPRASAAFGRHAART
jgi:hypothetical protein